jgi:S-adenosylmethionine hydrolase
VGQLALAPRGEDDPALILFVNCAPRRDARQSRADNEGEELLFGELENGVKVVAVNSKYSLSMIRDDFRVLRPVLIGRAGSQFRSRDNFPPIVGAVAQGIDLSPWLGDEIDPRGIIPEFKEGFIGYIDSFGNIKTTYRASSAWGRDLKPGQEIEVDINGTEIVARVATGSFNIPEGNFAFAPGSSGWDDRFWEIFQRGGNAAQSFKAPQVGSRVDLKALR